MSSQPLAIIWRSDERAPSRLSAESVYAEMIDSSIMICDRDGRRQNPSEHDVPVQHRHDRRCTRAKSALVG